MTHVIGHSIAWGLFKINKNVGRLTWGYFTRSEKIGTTCLVDVGNGEDLVPITLWDAHKMSLLEFAKTCNEKV